jgi:hypothetical protein
MAKVRAIRDKVRARPRLRFGLAARCTGSLDRCLARCPPLAGEASSFSAAVVSHLRHSERAPAWPEAKGSISISPDFTARRAHLAGGPFLSASRGAGLAAAVQHKAGHVRPVLRGKVSSQRSDDVLSISRSPTPKNALDHLRGSEIRPLEPKLRAKEREDSKARQCRDPTDHDDLDQAVSWLRHQCGGARRTSASRRTSLSSRSAAT